MRLRWQKVRVPDRASGWGGGTIYALPEYGVEITPPDAELPWWIIWAGGREIGRTRTRRRAKALVRLMLESASTPLRTLLGLQEVS